LIKSRAEVDTNTSSASRGLFSSIGCSYDDLFATMGFDSGPSTASVNDVEGSKALHDDTNHNHANNADLLTLTSGLKPLKDTFLINVQSTLNAPIYQMFPELEGYTGLMMI